MKVTEKYITGMANEVYHSRPEVSCSQIKNLLEEQKIDSNRENSREMVIGELAHAALLEETEAHKRYTVMPKELNFKYKKDREIRDQLILEAEKAHKVAITHDEFNTVQNMAMSLRLSPALKLIKNGVAESSVFGEIDGIPSRCRPDYFMTDKNIIVDIKTTADASPDGFAKSCAKFGYYIQEAWYRDVMESAGFGINDFIFVAICSKPIDSTPFHKIGVYRLNEIDVDFGRSEYQRALDIYRRLDTYNSHVYKDSGNGSIIQTLTLPSYIRYKHNASIA